MGVFLGIIGVLVFMLAYLAGQHALVAYQLKKRHMDSLGRLDDIVHVNLSGDTEELMSAAIDEELQEV